jgi:hypothetical protein
MIREQYHLTIKETSITIPIIDDNIVISKVIYARDPCVIGKR